MMFLLFSKDCEQAGVPESAQGRIFVIDKFYRLTDGSYEYQISSFGHKGECFSDVDIEESNGQIKLKEL